MDKISVIVPVYNIEKYIDKNLNSLVNQTYQNIEIIVVNDGTKDNSEEIINRYLKLYGEKIKYYKKKNGGLSSARNYGLSKSSGKYIIFIDGDDYVEPNLIEKLYNSCKENDSDIAICDIFDHYENLDKINIYKNFVPENYVSIYDDKRQLLNRFAAWNKIFKKDLFNEKTMRFEEGKIYEDLRLIPKLYLEANKISYVKEPLYHYIIREGSIMTSSGIKKNMDIISAFRDIVDYFKKKNVYDKFKDEIEYLVIDHALIASCVRVVKMSNFKDLKKNVEPFIKYVNENFPNYFNNKYYSEITKNKKIVLKLIQMKRFKLLKLILMLRG